MGMVVRTNTMALNAYRQLGLNNNAVAKSLEKLASGYRINRAGDDAAGLAISEKMKAQITGLETASANAQDGISLIQTAEGNLGEVHDMLNRMVELATKSANGTYTSTERQALQDEVNQLLEEIDRISQSANFNGTKLLDGSMGLNADAFEIGGAVSAKPASEGTALAALTFETIHTGSPTTTEVAPKFSVDMADLSIVGKIADATNAADVNATITIGGKAVKVFTPGANDTTAGTWENLTAKKEVAANAGADGDEIKLTGADIAKAIRDEGYVSVGGDVFKVSGSGTQVNFEYVGKEGADLPKGSAATAADAYDKAAVTGTTFSPKGDLVVNPGGNNAGTPAAETGKRVDCPVYKIDDAVVAVSGARAGIEATLAAANIQEGATLKIDDQTFTFVSKENATGDANEIVLDYSTSVTDNERLKAATEQLSHKSTANFQIGRGKDDSTIEIEQKVGNTNVYRTADELKALFTSSKGATAATGAGISLTVNEDKIVDGNAINVGGKTYTFGNGDGQLSKTNAAQNLVNALNKDGFVASLGDDGKTISINAKDAKASAPKIIGGGLTLQIGDTADPYNKMTVAVADMSTKGLDLDGLKKIGIMTEASASNAIDTIKNAINTVSSTRASMGALQNRLEHTINNLDVAAENLSAANSRIRDTDMAKEMMNYTKMNVLVQSAQAMLAQANQQPQSVLQLLQ